jgi:hypothetical protein
MSKLDFDKFQGTGYKAYITLNQLEGNIDFWTSELDNIFSEYDKGYCRKNLERANKLYIKLIEIFEEIYIDIED